MKLLLFLVIFIETFESIVASNQTCKSQAHLLDEIKSNSTINLFPVQNPNIALRAIAIFDFLHLLHVDIMQQQITIRGWVALEWKNEFVHWEAQDYCGVTHILSSGDKNQLWFPDVIGYTCLSTL